MPLYAQLFADLDALKLVNRRTYVEGGVRLENSAEHSWHVAMAAWALANHLDRKVSLERLLKLALVHDLGEIDAGDTFLYSADRHSVSDAERVGVSKLASTYEPLIPDMLELWDEQELGATPEAKLLKVADRLLPFLHNILSEGKTWRENGIVRGQVLAMHSFIEAEEPEIFGWMIGELDRAVENGWLKDS